MRLNTQCTPAVLVSDRVLSNVWWPVQIRVGLPDNTAKALVMWLNSTLGLLILLSSRAETEGAWVDFKKPTLQAMPVLDLTKLGGDDINLMSSTFDEIARQSIQPLKDIATDPARRRIDEVVCQVLRLPNLSDLRHSLGIEPILSLAPLRPRFLLGSS